MEIAIIALLAVVIILLLIVLFTRKKGTSDGISAIDVEDIVKEESDRQLHTTQSIINSANSALMNGINLHTQSQNEATDKFIKIVSENVNNQDLRQSEFMKNVEIKLENMRTSVERTLGDVRRENSEQLEKMRVVVEDKMQSTLNERLNQSFSIINERLERVHEGLTEMKNLTEGVTDLKKVLNGVKTRGVWGEVSLNGLLQQLLVAEQYEANVHIGRKGEVVEFAVLLPGKNEEKVYMPIDAKFPLEDYQRLVEASEIGDKAVVDAMGVALERRIKDEAKTIRDKYIKPPQTTDFAVLYLPIEGLFAEVARRRDLQEYVHSNYHVLIAGPTTLSALLNSLQVGFKTMAIQKRSREIWQLLLAFKNEFARFNKLLDETQQYMDKASDGIRSASNKTLTIQKKLSKVELLSDGQDEGEGLQ